MHHHLFLPSLLLFFCFSSLPTTPQPQNTTGTLLVSFLSTLSIKSLFFLFTYFVAFSLFNVFLYDFRVTESGWVRWRRRKRKSWSNCTKPRRKLRMLPPPPIIVPAKKPVASMRLSSSRIFRSITKFSSIPRLLFFYSHYKFGFL